MAAHRTEPNIQFQSQSHSNTNVRAVRPAPTASVHPSNEDNRAVVVYFDSEWGSDYGPHRIGRKIQFQSQPHSKTNALPVRPNPTASAHPIREDTRAIVVYFDSKCGLDYDPTSHRTQTSVSKSSTQQCKRTLYSFRADDIGTSNQRR